MESRKRVFLGLGSNLGNRLENIFKALEELSRIGKVERVSTVYESPPWGVENQPSFLNCVVELRTDSEPEDLLKAVKEIEQKLGRVKRFHWGPREIDIDILLYGEEVVDETHLKIPHPFIQERDFVLFPLLELDESLKDPREGRPYKYYAERLKNRLTPYCSLLSVGSFP
jgi:2-amino-4-hydroxy-6-hydroxymethyldihydropteridine diphosphokinase